MDEERKMASFAAIAWHSCFNKDNIDTADKMQTTAGALALEGNIAKKMLLLSANFEKRCRVIGQTNLSEWATSRSTSSCSGWSSRGGQTKCPYILDHNPCGSSSILRRHGGESLCCFYRNRNGWFHNLSGFYK
jgi:amidase